MQPGDTITPGQQPAKAPEVQPQQPAAPIQQPVEVASIQEAPRAIPQDQPAEKPESVFEVPVPQTMPNDSSGVSWTASEYVDHAKGPAWFGLVGVGIFVLAVATYFMLKDIVAPVLLAVAGLTTAIFAGRKPRVIQYQIDANGIHIGERAYSFGDFKSFSLTEAGPLPAILLTPLKRFLPPMTIFYDPNEEDKIIDALADYLPHEDREPDMIDRLMGRIRF